jgi:hypothetical protein
VYVLTINKKEETYFEVFKYIKNSIKFEPSTIVVDFEKSLFNGISKVFKNCKMSGCLFHFGQSIWREIQSLGISENYIKDLKTRECFRNFYNLAFVPYEGILYEFEKFQSTTHLSEISKEKILNFLIYFKNTYIVKAENNRFINLHLINLLVYTEQYKAKYPKNYVLSLCIVV